MAELASIIVKIVADSSDFTSGLKSASDQAKGFAEVGATLAAAGGAVTASLLAATEAAGSFGAAVFNVQQRTGLAAETISGLTMAAKSAGGSIDTVSISLRKMATEAESAANGNKAAVRLFDDLGISVLNADGSVKTMNDLLPEVTDALSKVHNSTELAADSMALFGRGGQSLMQVLKNGSQGLQDWIDKAKETGTSVSDSAAAQDKAFQIAQFDISQSLQGMAMSIGQVFIPALTDAAKYIEQMSVPIQQWISSHHDLIFSIGEVSIALVGTGGLLVGIGAVVAAMPIFTTLTAGVTTAFGGMLTAITDVGAALTVLSGVKSVADFSAGLSLIAEAAPLAAVGMVGLAAAFGAAVGAAVNWVIQGTAVQRSLDSLATTTLAQISYQHDMLTTTKAAADELKNHYNDAVDTSRMTIEQANVAVTERLKLHQQMDPALQANIASNKELNEVVKALTIIDAGYVDTGTKHVEVNKKLDDAIKNLVSSVEGETVKDQALVPAIQQLVNDKVSLSAIYDKLGPQVESYLTTLTAEDAKIPPLIQKLHDMNQARQDEIMWRETIAQLNRDSSISLTSEIALQNNANIALFNGLGIYRSFVNEGLDPAGKELDNVNEAMDASVQKSIESAVALRDVKDEAVANVTQWVNLTTALGIASTSTDLVSDANRKALRALQDFDNEQKTARDNSDALHRALQAQAAVYEEVTRQVSAAIKSGMGTFFDDLFKKGKGVFDSLIGGIESGGLSIGKAMATDISKALLGPITKAFSDFFTGLLTSSGLTGFLNGLGQKLGGIFSSVLGGGSNDPNFVGPQIPGGSSMSGALKGGVITAGIGAAIFAGEELYKKFTELGRDKSTFVQQYQNPFGNNLVDIVDQFNAARLTGQLTVSDATTTLNSVKTLIGNFEANIADWMQKGGDYAIVATRAQATMDADFGKNFSTLLDSMKTNIDQRQGVIDDPIKDSTDKNTLSTDNLTNSMDKNTGQLLDWNKAFGISTTRPFGGDGTTAGSPVHVGTKPPNPTSLPTPGVPIEGTQNNYGNASAHNGTAVTGPNGSTIYLNAQQISDLMNSGGSYTAASGYAAEISSLGSKAGYSSVTGTYFSPGSMASMTPGQLAALGIASYGVGNPFVPYDQLAMIHKGEAVIPASQNQGGGGASYNFAITINSAVATGDLRQAAKVLTEHIIDRLQESGTDGTRMKRTLGV